MRKTICDGRHWFEDSDVEATVRVNVEVVKPDGNRRRQSLDFCDVCYNDFLRWMGHLVKPDRWTQPN